MALQVQPDDLAARRPVWSALSSMFLDADVTLTRNWRANLLAASPYSLAELQVILIEEVYPVCWSNLNAVAGVSTAFDAAWLETTILQRGSASVTFARLQDLARLAIPDSTEWLATQAAVTSLRGAAGVAAT
jgi:hypothetical protein